MSAWEAVDPPRVLTRWESRVVAALAPNARAARIDDLRVFERCTCGCRSISFQPELRAHHLLAEAETTDVDGMTISVLLFGSPDGRELHELEIQRPDGQAIAEPAADAISVTSVTIWA